MTVYEAIMAFCEEHPEMTDDEIEAFVVGKLGEALCFHPGPECDPVEDEED